MKKNSTVRESKVANVSIKGDTCPFAFPNGAFLLFIIFIITTCIAISSYGAEVVDKIVAIVNDEIITQSEVEESMLTFIADYRLRYGVEEAEDRLDEAKGDALNRLIEERLILQEAKRRGIQVNETELDERLNLVKSKFGSEGEFEKVLSKSGLTLEKLKNKYREQLMMKTLVNGIISYNVRIAPTQIAAYYYGHKNEFIQSERVKFRIILLKFKPEQEEIEISSLAEELLRRIHSGEDFLMLAKQYSEGPNAIDGGDMGFVSKGNMVKEIDEAIFSLNEGGVSGVIETSLGCNIVKVEKKIPESEISLEEATPIVRERLFQREAELALREFIDNLKKEAYIDIKE